MSAAGGPGLAGTPIAHLHAALTVLPNTPVPCSHLLVANTGCLLLPGKSSSGAASTQQGLRHDASASHPLSCWSMCECHLQSML